MSLICKFWFGTKMFKILDTAPKNISIKSFYSDSTKYETHKKLCSNRYGQKEILPKEDDRIDFKNFDKQYKTEILGFNDLECILAPEDEVKQCPDCVFNCKWENSFTVAKNKHKPIIYSYCLVSTDGRLLYERSKVCPDGDAHVQLLEELLSIEKMFWR